MWGTINKSVKFDILVRKAKELLVSTLDGKYIFMRLKLKQSNVNGNLYVLRDFYCKRKRTNLSYMDFRVFILHLQTAHRIIYCT